MLTVLGSIDVVLGMLAWGGQIITLASPVFAGRLGLTEIREEVDPMFWADVRAEALWDSVTLWTLPLAGILMLAGSAMWPAFGLLALAIWAAAGAATAVMAALELRGGI